jgi:hypothetical protein
VLTVVLYGILSPGPYMPMALGTNASYKCNVTMRFTLSEQKVPAHIMSANIYNAKTLYSKAPILRFCGDHLKMV